MTRSLRQRRWIKRADERLGLKPERLAADTAYGTGRFLHWLIGTGITPHIPVWDMSQREEGILSRADFTFDRHRDLYETPCVRHLRSYGVCAHCHDIGILLTTVGPSFIARAPATAVYIRPSPSASVPGVALMPAKALL
jgi:hypothetical protein